jgi:hypothetical protein
MEKLFAASGNKSARLSVSQLARVPIEMAWSIKIRKQLGKSLVKKKSRYLSGACQV